MGHISVTDRLTVPEEALAGFCRRWHVSRIGVTGIGRWDDAFFRGRIGVVLHPEAGHIPSAFALTTMAEELERIFGARVLPIWAGSRDVSDDRPGWLHDLIALAHPLHVEDQDAAD